MDLPRRWNAMEHLGEIDMVLWETLHDLAMLDVLRLTDEKSVSFHQLLEPTSPSINIRVSQAVSWP